MAKQTNYVTVTANTKEHGKVLRTFIYQEITDSNKWE